MKITVGHVMKKPIETQEACNMYSEMVQEITHHNENAVPGEHIWKVDDRDDCYEVVEGEVIPDDSARLETTKRGKITESKDALATYLAAHPLKWTDGKYYNVTSGKQAMLTNTLFQYQLAQSTGQSFKLTWNSTGDESVEWRYEDLTALAFAISNYVNPFVTRQQEIEIAIKACTTMDELEQISIQYDDTDKASVNQV